MKHRSLPRWLTNGLAVFILLSPLVICGLLTAVAAAEPTASASQARLQALEGKLSALRAQQDASVGELSRLQSEPATIQTEIDKVVSEFNTIANLRKNEVALAAEAAIRGISVAEMVYQSIVAETHSRKKLAGLQGQLANVKARISALDNEISSRQQQIDQAQASLEYWKNPLRAENIENEGTHLKNLKAKPVDYDPRLDPSYISGQANPRLDWEKIWALVGEYKAIAMNRPIVPRPSIRYAQPQPQAYTDLALSRGDLPYAPGQILYATPYTYMGGYYPNDSWGTYRTPSSRIPWWSLIPPRHHHQLHHGGHRHGLLFGHRFHR